MVSSSCIRFIVFEFYNDFLDDSGSFLVYFIMFFVLSVWVSEYIEEDFFRC